MKYRFLSLLLLFLCVVSFGQNRANFWQFGYGGGIDFTDLNNPVSITSSIGNVQEGATSMSDEFGNLLMYSDGANLFDRNGDIMPNGTNLGGEQSAAQAGLIIPHPNDDQLYYLFSQSGAVPAGGNTGLKYSIIDMSLPGNGTVAVPLGDVSTTKAVSLISGTQENCAAVPDQSGGYWIVTHLLNATGGFQAFHLDGTTGVLNTAPVVSGTAGGSGLGGTAISVLKFNACSDKLALVEAGEFGLTSGRRAEIWDFDNASGMVTTYFATLDPGDDKLYGGEFSPNGRYFYVNSLLNGSVWQYDLTNANPQSTQFLIGASASAFQHGTLQLGPDGKIYIATQLAAGNVALSVINSPNNAGAGCGFVQNGFPLPNSVSGQLSLPPFVSSFVNNVAQFDYTDLCVGTSVDFSYTFSGDVRAGSVSWDFGGDGFSSSDSPSHTFNTAGDYEIVFSVTDDACGDVKTISETITVGPDPIIDPTLSYCSGESTSLTMGDGGSYCFYENSDGTGVIGCGDTVDHVFTGSGTQTVYVNIETFTGGNFGPTDVTQTDLGSVSTDYQDFTIVTELTLVSFEVESGFSNLNNNVWEIRNSSNALVATGNITAAANSRFVVEVNTTLLPDDYQLSFDIKSFKFSSTPDREDVGVIQFTASSWNDYLANPYTGYIAANWVIEPPQEPWCAALPITVDQTPAALCCTSPGATVTIQNATNDTIKACDNTTIDANISGGGSVYQWYQDGAVFGSEGGAPGATETSGTISVSGSYAIRVADNSTGLSGCADGDTVYVLITQTPDAPTVNTPVDVCTGQNIILTVTDSNAAYSYGWTGPNSYSGSGAQTIASANATLSPDQSGMYGVIATNNGCAGPGVTVTVNITQGPTVTVNEDTTFCAYPFDLADLHGTPSNGTISYLSNADATITSSVNADGTYKIVVTDNGCADTTEVTTTETGDPVASWSGGTGVCTGADTLLTLNVTGGTAPYRIVYNDGTSDQSQTGLAADGTVRLGAGTYTLDSVIDNNGCVHAGIADAETITEQDDVAATISVLCDNGVDPVDGSFANNQFQIMVNIDAGDTSSVAIDIIGTTYGVTFSETSTGVWHSTPIVEDTTLEISVGDSRCGTVSDRYNRVCSCPGIATLSGATTVCNNETAELTLTVDGVGPFDFELHNNGAVYNNATVLGLPYGGSQTNVDPTLLGGLPATITITVQDSGTYSIANLLDYEGGVQADACEGSEVGNITIGYHTHPDGDIAVTGDNPICLDGTTDVEIDVTQGSVGPFTAYYTQNGVQSTSVTPGTAVGVAPVTADTGVVILDSIIDANGCASPQLNESVTITAHDTLDVDVNIVCGDDASTTTPDDGFYLEVTTATGIIQTVTETTGNGLTFNNVGGTWTSGITNENNSVDIQVTDDNGCHTVTVTGLQQTCSCPTTVELGYATNGNACAGDDVVLQIDSTSGVPATWTSATVSVTGPNGAVLTNANITAIPHQFSVPDSGEYTLTVFTDNGEGCDAQIDNEAVTANIYSLPTGTLTGGPEVCFGSPSDPVNITLTGAGSSWAVDYTQDGSANNTTITTGGQSELVGSTTNSSDTGTYTITGISMTVGALTCTSTDFGTSAEIAFGPAQGASVLSDVSICTDSLGTLEANDEGVGVTYTWTLNNATVGTGLTLDVTNAPGLYTLTTEKNGCADQTDNATVTVTTITVTAVASSTLVSEGDDVTLSTITNGTTCQWYDPTMVAIGGNCTEITTPITPGGIYTVVSTDGQCEGTDQVEVGVVVPIQVPDAFTPNGDGINDRFTITGFETYTKGSVAIYNRWGNLVYFMYGGDNYADNQWDGTMNSKELPVGIYYYTIDLGLDESEAELVPDAAPKSGSVMLMK